QRFDSQRRAVHSKHAAAEKLRGCLLDDHAIASLHGRIAARRTLVRRSRACERGEHHAEQFRSLLWRPVTALALGHSFGLPSGGSFSRIQRKALVVEPAHSTPWK